MNAQAEPLLHPVARSNPQSGLPKWRVYRPHGTNRWRLPAVERIGRRQVEAGQLEPGIRATFCVTCRRLLTCILHALGGVCLGFLQLSTKISCETETNRWLSSWLLPKPKQPIDRPGEAPNGVLPAASPLTAEPLFWLALLLLIIY
jgi:hypothetical protein